MDLNYLIHLIMVNIFTFFYIEDKRNLFLIILKEQEYRIVYNEKNLVVEILINSTVKSFKRALRQLFLSNLSNKYFINSSKYLNFMQNFKNIIKFIYFF